MTPEALENGVVRLRQIEAADLPMVYYLAHLNPWSFRWAFRDVVPQFERFEQTMWYRAVCHFGVEECATGSTVGIAVGWSDSGLRDSLKVDVLYPDRRSYRKFWWSTSDVMAQHLSVALDVHKVLFEVPSSLYREVMDTLEPHVQVEGSIGEYFWLGGTFVDMTILRYEPAHRGVG